MRNLFLMICIFTMISVYSFPLTGLANANSIYKDVSTNHWAYKSIVHMKEANIIVAKEEGLFYPSEHITRAEVAQYIYNALNIEKAKWTSFRFEDVPQNADYSDAVYTLTGLGVIHPAKRFYPNANLTRSELCKMIAEAFQIEVDEKNNSRFYDLHATHWAKHYVESLADTHIIKGTGGNYFSPKGTVTRAEIAIILDRVLSFQQQIASHELVYDFLQKHYINSKNDYPNWTQEVIALVNQERSNHGVSVLEEDVELNQLAVIKGNDMITRKYFEHYSPLYGYPWDMAGIFDYSFTSFGENIAKNFTTPESVVQAWMESTSHRKNILNDTFTNIGVACSRGSDGQLYWVQHFSSK